MEVKVKKVVPNAKLPVYATPGAACFDLHSTSTQMILSYLPKTFGTGLSFEVPEGHALLIFSRSGHGFNHDVRLSNCVGVVDSDYRGEVMVKMTCDNTKSLLVKEGDRIAQGMIVPVNQVTFVEADELTGSERGNGGFGSTGR